MTDDNQSEPEQKQQPSEDGTIVRWTKILGVFQVVLAVCAVISAAIAFGQLSVMRAQLEEIRGSSTQTEKLIASNADLAAAAKAQAVAQAKSADVAENAYSSAQRATIVSNTASLQPLQEGGGIKAAVIYMNVGKEPAPTDSSISIKVFQASDQVTGSMNAFIKQNEQSCLSASSVIGRAITSPLTGGFQNNSFTISMDSNSEDIPQERRIIVDKSIIEGPSTIVVTGCFVYSTVKKVHHTSSCYFYHAKRTASIGSLNICDAGNATD